MKTILTFEGQDLELKPIPVVYNKHAGTAPANAVYSGKDLVCFCAPRACHGDVLLREANK